MPSDLIPVGVRVALRNAMGGWGPYTVREIEDKFTSYDFELPMEMGYTYEELIRRFSELSNETAGEHFIPRDVELAARLPGATPSQSAANALATATASSGGLSSIPRDGTVLLRSETGLGHTYA